MREGTVIASEDSHGGFHGDGMYFGTLVFSDGTFLDRHSRSVDSYDDSDVLNRGSLNLTIEIYDMDTDTLYYVEFDS